jgi:hypothetical protein
VPIGPISSSPTSAASTRWTDTAGLRRAHEAGFDQVLVKNALQDRAAQVVDELTSTTRD